MSEKKGFWSRFKKKKQENEEVLAGLDSMPSAPATDGESEVVSGVPIPETPVPETPGPEEPVTGTPVSKTPATDASPAEPVEEQPAPVAPVAKPVAPKPAAPAAMSLDALSSMSTDETAAEEAIAWTNKMNAGLARTSSGLSDNISAMFKGRKLDDDVLYDLEDILIQTDMGLELAEEVTEALKEERFKGRDLDVAIKEVLAEKVEKIMDPVAWPLEIRLGLKPHVVLIVGVNGAGKTTTIGKLASQYQKRGLKVKMAAGDTFRAAAIDQLKVWADRTGTPIVAKEPGADSAALAYEALEESRDDGTDVLLIDTAGRLQNRTDLMQELEKVVRVVKKIDDTAPHSTLLVLDATIGQNAHSQVEAFRDTAGVTGLVMTKLDGTAKGGVLVSLARKFGLPIHAIGVGEAVSDLQSFTAKDFGKALLGLHDYGDKA